MKSSLFAILVGCVAVCSTAAELPVCGRAFEDTATPWVRLPERLKGRVSPSAWASAQQSAGLYCSFTTTSARVSVRWSADGAGGLDVYRRQPGGAWSFVTAARPAGKGVGELSFRTDPDTLYRVYLPLFARVTSLTFETDANAALVSMPERKVKPIVCFGGVCTQGAEVSRPGLAWTSQLGRLLDLPVINLGVEGGVLDDAALELLAGLDAHGYVLMPQPDGEIRAPGAGYEAFVRKLEARKPRTPMVLCSWPSPAPAHNVFDRYLNDLKLRVTQEDWEVWGGMLFVVPTADMCPAAESDTTADGVLPNDHGAQVMARGIASIADVAFRTVSKRTTPILEMPLAEEKDNWFRSLRYEPRDPVLAKPCAPGLHGCVQPLQWIDGENAAGDENAKTLNLQAWRNERVHGQVTVWTDVARKGLRAAVSDLKGANGATIAADRIDLRFVRYVMSWGRRYTEPLFRGDCLDRRACFDLAANGFRPLWLTVNVPAEAVPGDYSGTLTLHTVDGASVSFAVRLAVLRAALPEKNDFFLDFWQHPFSIARYHHVEPLSPLHYALLEPHYREMAAAGQKVITTWIEDSVWGQGEGTPRTLVKYVRWADGRTEFDFSKFDEYVAFAQKCGIGPQIHCYSLVNWAPEYHCVSGETGDDITVKAKPGDAQWKAFWGPLLKAVEAHAREKGWLGNVYIALDEVGKEGETIAANFLKETAPGLKLTMAGNQLPERYGFTIDTYSLPLQGKTFLKPEVDEDLAARRAAGRTTTFYVCCWPLEPNICTANDFCEMQWLGLYASYKKYDGVLRWATTIWPRDPFFGEMLYSPGWALPGDYYIAYPGALFSPRWEMLRDSIEDFRKIAVLRKLGRPLPELDEALKEVDFPKISHLATPLFRAKVARVQAAIDAAARTSF